MIKIKTENEIEKMRKSGSLAAEVMKRTLGFIHPYLPTFQVDKFIDSQIKSFHALPSFKGFEGYKFSSCISINEEVVHGLPSERKIRNGDLVSIDLGVLYEDYHSDMCGTLEVGTKLFVPDKSSTHSWELGECKEKKFLETGIRALDKALLECRPGNFVGDISEAMQKTVEGNGYFVVRDLVGHGIGTSLHEDPQIPCYGKAKNGEKLLEGMVLAVEVMYTKKNTPLKILSDKWTFSTADKSLSAMFEHTVAITKNGYEVLTKL
ncbi:MAG: type I methionyl aminopeptidase [bacterium]